MVTRFYGESQQGELIFLVWTKKGNEQFIYTMYLVRLLQMGMHIFTPSHAHIHTITRTQWNYHKHTITRTHSHNHTHTFTSSHAHIHAITRTQSHNHTHIITRTHINAHERFALVVLLFLMFSQEYVYLTLDIVYPGNNSVIHTVPDTKH